MKSPIIKIAMLLFGIILSVTVKAQIVTTNPLEYVALAEGNELILAKVRDQMDGQKENRPWFFSVLFYICHSECAELYERRTGELDCLCRFSRPVVRAWYSGGRCDRTVLYNGKRMERGKNFPNGFSICFIRPICLSCI